MKIYLDSCSLQRPLDDQNQIRIATETEAVLGILSMWENNELDLVGSEILNFEAKKNRQPERLNYILELLSRIKTFIKVDDEVNVQNFSLKME